jgi:GR25 family glycosyltransferase involved in LPS biosynthesis
MAIHHYIISGVDAAREPYLKNEFEIWGLEDKDITWVKGSNKDDLSDELIKHICNGSMKKGQISCTYKHFLSLQDMIRNQREYAVIMEDDVNFRDNIQERLKKYLWELNRNHPDWNVLFDGDINTYYGPGCQYKEEKVVPGRLVYPKSNKDEIDMDPQGMGGSTRGANYYLINLKTAKILCENFLPFTTIVDHQYNWLFRKLDFNVYWSMPPFVHKLKRRSTLQFDN